MNGRAREWAARVWVFGQPQEVHRRHDDGGLNVEIVTPDGHVAQMGVTRDGEVHVRAWLHDDLHENGGGNRTAFTASGHLPPRQATASPAPVLRPGVAPAPGGSS